MSRGRGGGINRFVCGPRHRQVIGRNTACCRGIAKACSSLWRAGKAYPGACKGKIKPNRGPVFENTSNEVWQQFQKSDKLLTCNHTLAFTSNAGREEQQNTSNEVLRHKTGKFKFLQLRQKTHIKFCTSFPNITHLRRKT